jgi:hypothetical protein
VRRYPQTCLSVPMRQLPNITLPLGYRRVLFPDAHDSDAPVPVVYFGVIERFTSLHQFRTRLLLVSSMGTVYLCHPNTGVVTHTLALSDGQRLCIEADAQVREGVGGP